MVDEFGYRVDHQRCWCILAGFAVDTECYLHFLITVLRPSSEDSTAPECLAFGPWPTLVFGVGLAGAVGCVAADAHGFWLEVWAQPDDEFRLVIYVFISVHQLDCVGAVGVGFDVGRCRFEEESRVFF